MDFRLLPLCEEDIADYKKDMRKAFQMGAGSEFGKSYEVTNGSSTLCRTVFIRSVA